MKGRLLWRLPPGPVRFPAGPGHVAPALSVSSKLPTSRSPGGRRPQVCPRSAVGTSSRSASRPWGHNSAHSRTACLNVQNVCGDEAGAAGAVRPAHWSSEASPEQFCATHLALYLRRSTPRGLGRVLDQPCAAQIWAVFLRSLICRRHQGLPHGCPRDPCSYRLSSPNLSRKFLHIWLCPQGC